MKFTMTLALILLAAQPALANGQLDGLWEGKFVCKGVANDGLKAKNTSKTALEGRPSTIEISASEVHIEGRPLAWNVSYDHSLFSGVTTSLAEKAKKGKIAMVACGSGEPVAHQEIRVGDFKVCDSEAEPECVKGSMKLTGAFSNGFSGILTCKAKYKRVSREVRAVGDCTTVRN